jgi:hypothetical protein
MTGRSRTIARSPLAAAGAQYWVGSTFAIGGVALATLGVMVAAVAQLGRSGNGGD